MIDKQKLLPETEWEDLSIRVKKDPAWPYHGTDIEFNGLRYLRSDTVSQQLEAAEKMAKALEYCLSELWDDWHSHMSEERFNDYFKNEKQALQEYRKVTGG